jgi:dienelactone hydrolase
LQSELRQLASHFDTRARPAHGRYRDRPAITDANGVVDLPPPQVSARTVVLTGFAVGATIGLTMAARHRAGEGRAQAALAPADDVSLTRGAELAAADGGYDGSSVDRPVVDLPSANAAPSYIDLR